MSTSAAARIENPDKARDILFQHTFLCQTCVPFRDPATRPGLGNGSTAMCIPRYSLATPCIRSRASGRSRELYVQMGFRYRACFRTAVHGPERVEVRPVANFDDGWLAVFERKFEKGSAIMNETLEALSRQRANIIVGNMHSTTGVGELDLTCSAAL